MAPYSPEAGQSGHSCGCKCRQGEQPSLPLVPLVPPPSEVSFFFFPTVFLVDWWLWWVVQEGTWCGDVACPAVIPQVLWSTDEAQLDDYLMMLLRRCRFGRRHGLLSLWSSSNLLIHMVDSKQKASCPVCRGTLLE